MAPRTTTTDKTGVTLLPVSQLVLDRENPRLPEDMLGKPEAKILEYALEDLLLEELALSFVENGYFASEPLSVLRPQKGQKQTHTVLEGNRRLATLRFLLKDRIPNDGELDLEEKPTRRQLDRLKYVPCHVVDHREDVDAMIGFRHIGGLRKWESEAKARFIYEHVHRLVDKAEKHPFKELGRKIGSNAQGVRNNYIALAIAHWAREEAPKKLESRVRQLSKKSRFGVWQRALNSAEVRDYIGFGGGATYQEVVTSLSKLKKAPLLEVIKDLTIADGEQRPLVRDSRYLTDYGRILANEGAKETLRETRDIDIARMMVDKAELPVRLGKLDRQIRAFVDEVASRDELPDGARSVARSVEKSARLLRLSIESTLDGE